MILSKLQIHRMVYLFCFAQSYGRIVPIYGKTTEAALVVQKPKRKNEQADDFLKVTVLGY